MKIVQVTYTTSASFAASNQANIQAVMKELQQLNYPGIRYTTCLLPDGKTFVHTALFQSDEDQQLLNGCLSFQYFQQALKESVPEMPPSPQLLTLVGSSYTIF